MRAVSLILALFLFKAQTLYSQDKFHVDLSELEKEVAQAAGKPYHLGGFLEFEPVFFGIDRSAAFSQLNFNLKRSGNTFMRGNCHGQQSRF